MRKPRRAATALSKGSRWPSRAGRTLARRFAAEHLDELAHVAQRHGSHLRDVPVPELHGEGLGRRRLPCSVTGASHEKASSSSSAMPPSLASGSSESDPRPACPSARRALLEPRTIPVAFLRPCPGCEEMPSCARRELAPRHVRLTPSTSTARAASVASATLPRRPTRARRPHAACDGVPTQRSGRPRRVPQAVARGAGAVRTVEREHARFDGGSEMPQSMQRSARSSRTARPRGLHEQAPSPSLSASSTLSVSRPSAFLEHQAVDHHSRSWSSSDRARSRRRGRPRAVDAGPYEPSRRRRSSSSLSSPFAPARWARGWRGASLLQSEHTIDDLLHRLRLDALAAARTVGNADARVEETQ